MARVVTSVLSGAIIMTSVHTVMSVMTSVPPSMTSVILVISVAIMIHGRLIKHAPVSVMFPLIKRKRRPLVMEQGRRASFVVEMLGGGGGGRETGRGSEARGRVHGV